MKYRQKNVEVEAVRFDGRLVGQWDAVSHTVVPGTNPPWFPIVCRVLQNRAQSRDLAEGEAATFDNEIYWRVAAGAIEHARAGYWIVRQGEGAPFAVGHGEFMARYEPI
jgi:hypothetical protein